MIKNVGLRKVELIQEAPSAYSDHSHELLG